MWCLTHRQTHRPTDVIGDRSVRRVLTLAILIESDALIRSAAAAGELETLNTVVN